MASMNAIGVLKVPSSSNVGRKAIPRNLSFSASQLSGDKIATVSVSAAAGRRSCTRKPVIVTPMAVSDSQNSQTCIDPYASRSVLGIILGGGAGTRLYPLTKKWAKPIVPLGANYRLIDIPVSNCLNSNVSKIYVLTQFNSASLNRHLSRAYASNMGGYKNEGFVEVLAAQQSPENPNWFQECRLDLLRINFLWSHGIAYHLELLKMLMGSSIARP
ncbi:glucose-1-phosphate adenylyltransferase small subunit 2, chloroplastic-like [Gastrolobium bilobum]|uniref:glucose-1-phosphate adenylyltransferase small subunit 2, chloroplastic-like n=1 Tax=Gastrolobium bilobum TaxID=150636 RepID=UPI002AB1625C|nr:glucose-1-phosphate adenylyltransferase small subunit 2, chloroplastic-like [Gastrolobium bilobum]